MNKIILCPNATRDDGLKVTATVNEMLYKSRIKTVICPFFEAGDIPLPERLHYSTIDREVADADMAVTFGGDGTILRAARALSEKGVPILAINMGTKGFMAELETDELYQIYRVIDGEYRIDKRMMVDVDLIRSGEKIYSGFALNDAVIGSMGRVVDLEIFGDEHAITKFSGDGVVLSTPTGSTAYSMAAGGPVVEPSAENIIVTPICPHVLVAKSFVLAPDRRITAVLGKRRLNPAYLAVDGQSIPLEPGDVITVAKSQRETRLVQLSNKSFYKTVHDKLGERT